MNEGVFISLSGAKLQELRLETVANNLANAHTAGFKADRLASRSFQFHLEGAGAAAESTEGPPLIDRPLSFFSGIYSETRLIGTDFSQGYQTHTGNKLNVCLEGPGFFAIDTPSGVRYTRQGSFDLNRDGELVTVDGHKVRGRGLSGLGKGLIDIDTRGNVFVDGKRQGEIEIVEFKDMQSLRKEGHSLFAAPPGAETDTKAENTQVMQGFLEMANINVVKEMVNLIELNRLYEAYQKSITSIDESTKTLIDELSS